MNTAKIIIRILIVFTFFAPLTKCNSNFYSSNNVVAVKSDSVQDNDTLLNNLLTTDSVEHVSQNKKADTSNALPKKSFWDKIVTKIISPTDDAFSAYGTIIWFPNIVGSVSLALSFLLSLFLIFNWKFLKKKRIRLFLSVLNLLSYSVFIVLCLYEHDWKLLWGVWLLLGLIIADIILQLWLIKKEPV